MSHSHADPRAGQPAFGWAVAPDQAGGGASFEWPGPREGGVVHPVGSDSREAEDSAVEG